MDIIDRYGNRIELSNERWQHIIKEHPEVKNCQDKLPEVVKQPDLIKHSKKDKDVLLYYRYYPEILGGKYLLVVVKIRSRSLVLTCYVTDRIKEGDVLWQRD